MTPKRFEDGSSGRELGGSRGGGAERPEGGPGAGVLEAEGAGDVDVGAGAEDGALGADQDVLEIQLHVVVDVHHGMGGVSLGGGGQRGTR